MLKEAATEFNVELFFMDPDPDAPCSQFKEHFTIGDFKNEQDVLSFAKGKDIITIEIENVNTTALRKIKDMGLIVFPDPSLIETIKDKGAQKEFYHSHNIPTSPFILVAKADPLNALINDYPIVQKLRTGGYDGRGVQVLKNEQDLSRAFSEDSILEHFVPFEQEISVLVARNSDGEVSSYPPVGMKFNEEANLVEFLYSPANLHLDLQKKAKDIAEQLADELELVGIMAVEMFHTKEDLLLVNEVAPRPHNSGHQSIEGNTTSQYAQHLRAILGLPLGDTSIVKPSVMVNLLGAKQNEGDVNYQGLEAVQNDPNIYVHLYGKKKTKPFRKMGHVTILDDSLDAAIEKAEKVKESISCVSLSA
ncbi:MAG: 5-(carboxyamino)imidazole ribonucleotide synthase [Flavobacteriales bacterium]|nr:5-(carboxyamino)imidazole ribonucleotide synthase [Flavobacteriales bacterium]